MTNPTLIHLSRNGQQFGPYTLVQVNHYLEDGTVLPTDYAWAEGSDGWVPVTQFPGVNAPAPSPAEATPPPSREIMLLIDGQSQGPYTVGQIRDALEAGSFDGNVKAKRPKMPGWMPLKNWGEFKGIGPKKQSLGNAAQASSRNPHAIDCFGSGILLPTIFFIIPVLVSDPMIWMVISWIVFLGWVFGKPLLFEVADDLGGDFGHRGPFEFAFRVYFYILLMFFGLSFLGLIFSASRQVTWVAWTLQLPFLYLTWCGFRGLLRYFVEYKQSGIDLALVIIGAIPLVVIQVITGLGMIIVLFVLKTLGFV